jgi:formate--tetrahydrofolate ligase
MVIGLGGHANGQTREDHFVITAASEIMAVLCLSADLKDLKKRLARIVVGYTFDNRPVTAEQLQAVGAMTALLKDAIRPNLIQTLEHTPALIHGGPFANIAHGCNSIRATKAALKMADYTITEAGFGADLGAEKFFDIKCREAGLRPDAVVLVASIEALKYNGGVRKEDLKKENPGCAGKGHCQSGEAHRKSPEVRRSCGRCPEFLYHGYGCGIRLCRKVLSRKKCRFRKGYRLDGRRQRRPSELAQKVLAVLERGESRFHPLYELEQPLKNKIETIAREIYGADGVQYAPAAEKQLKRIEEEGGGDLPVCIAKTQYSLSDDPSKLGRPEHYMITVRECYLSAGAGFVVVMTGQIMAMPGLPKMPALSVSTWMTAAGSPVCPDRRPGHRFILIAGRT